MQMYRKKIWKDSHQVAVLGYVLWIGKVYGQEGFQLHQMLAET